MKEKKKPFPFPMTQEDLDNILSELPEKERKPFIKMLKKARSNPFFAKKAKDVVERELLRRKADDAMDKWAIEFPDVGPEFREKITELRQNPAALKEFMALIETKKKMGEI